MLLCGANYLPVFGSVAFYWPSVEIGLRWKCLRSSHESAIFQFAFPSDKARLVWWTFFTSALNDNFPNVVSALSSHRLANKLTNAFQYNDGFFYSPSLSNTITTTTTTITMITTTTITTTTATAINSIFTLPPHQQQS